MCVWHVCGTCVWWARCQQCCRDACLLQGCQCAGAGERTMCMCWCRGKGLSAHAHQHFQQGPNMAYLHPPPHVSTASYPSPVLSYPPMSPASAPPMPALSPDARVPSHRCWLACNPRRGDSMSSIAIQEGEIACPASLSACRTHRTLQDCPSWCAELGVSKD